MDDNTNTNKIIYFIFLIIVAGAIYFIAGGSIDWAGLKTQKLASIPDDYYQAMSISGGVGKNLEGIAFSPDGKNVVFHVKKASGEFIFFNNDSSPAYDSAYLPPLPFSADSKHYVYSATKNKQSFIVLDGKEQEHTPDSIEEVQIGSKGLPAYIVTSYSKSPNDSLKQYVVFNGKQGKTYRSIHRMMISPDGESAVYYGCQLDRSSYDVMGDSSGFCDFVSQDINGDSHSSGGISFDSGLSEAIYRENIAFSPDGKLLAYVTRTWGDDSLNINGVKTYDTPGDYQEKNIKSVVFSPDSQHTAYVVQGCDETYQCQKDKFSDTKGGVNYVVLDNTITGNIYNEITSLTFNNKGQLAYFARNGEQWYFVNGDSIENAPSDYLNFFSHITFASNGSYLYTYTNKDKKVILFSDGAKVAQGDSMDEVFLPGFTPDNKIIYTKVDPDLKSMAINIGGTDRYRHDFIYTLLTAPDSVDDPMYKFTKDGKLVYGAIDGKDISVFVKDIR